MHKRRLLNWIKEGEFIYHGGADITANVRTTHMEIYYSEPENPSCLQNKISRAGVIIMW